MTQSRTLHVRREDYNMPTSPRYGLLFLNRCSLRSALFGRSARRFGRPSLRILLPKLAGSLLKDYLTS
jgi:hypothetical protein